MPNVTQLLSLLLFTLRAHHQDKQRTLKETLVTENAKENLTKINTTIRLQKEQLQAKLDAL